MAEKEFVTKYPGYPGDAEFAVILEVRAVNHKPHMFMIGSRHVEHASEYCGGLLGKATLEAIPCAHPQCNLLHREHTSDLVAFVQLQRDCAQDEMQAWLSGLLPWTEQHGIEGFAFVENKGYWVRQPQPVE